MGLQYGLALALVAAFAAVATWAIREVATRVGALDTPNSRSAHVRPTPRLGGIGIMMAFLPAASVAVASHGGQGALVIGTTALISLVGLLDDLRSLSARVRLGAQVVAAALVVGSEWSNLGGAWALFGALPHWVLAPMSVLWIVWLTNLYNFMDGIDGLAGGQAVIGGTAMAMAAMASGGSLSGELAAVLAASAAGFLLLNHPPASIFMGDVGSTAIGFLFASLPFVEGNGGISVEVVGLSLGLFVLDATFTLIRRVWRGERLTQAHRSHLYQRPLALGVTHRSITWSGYCGMFVVACGALAFVHLGVVGRLVVVAATCGVFGLMASVVWRLEVRQRGGGKVTAEKMAPK